MNPYFETLGNTVLEQWQEHNFALAKFPELARTAMDTNPPAENIDLDDLIHEFLSSEDQPLQGHSAFGQPELIAFHNKRFYIQILFWMEGTTKIHQHGFSGAFHVMHGSSVHSEYEFLNTQPISPHLHIGDLNLTNIALLETGSTCPITSGSKCIHSLFHLDSPSVTIVIRTHHDEGNEAQFNYLPPHIAVDPLHADALTQKRSQLLDVLATTDPASYAPRIQQMLNSLDFEQGFTTLHLAMPQLQELGEWEATLAVFEAKHGTLAEGVSQTLAESLRREYITQLRYQIENPEHRFFLALLMNVENRKDIFNFVTKRYPDQSPTDTILRWAEELIEPTDYGLTLLDATFPESIDADIDTQFNLLIETLKQSLEETTAEYADIQTALVNSSLSPLFK